MADGEVEARPANSAPSSRVKDCRDPWTQVSIRANGDVLPCCHTLQRLGNLGDASLEEIWRGPGFQAFRRFLLSRTPLPVCQSCFVRGWKDAPRPALRRRVRAGLEELVVRAGISSGRDIDVRVRLNSTVFRVGDSIHIVIGLDARNTARCGLVDISVFADDPTGTRFWLRSDGRMTVVGAEPGAVIAAIEPFSFSELEVLGLKAGAWTLGRYTVTAAVSLTGTAPAQRSNWLAHAATGFEFQQR